MNDNIKEAFEKTKIAGAVAAGALDEVAKIIKPGITTNEIDKICYEFINDNKAYSAPLFYRGFPKSCCTSANHVVCHGIPSNKILNILNINNNDRTIKKILDIKFLKSGSKIKKTDILFKKVEDDN